LAGIGIEERITQRIPNENQTALLLITYFTEAISEFIIFFNPDSFLLEMDGTRVNHNIFKDIKSKTKYYINERSKFIR